MTRRAFLTVLLVGVLAGIGAAPSAAIAAPAGESGRVVDELTLTAPLDYCHGALSYLPVYNTGATATKFQIVFYNQATSRAIYGSVEANDIAYPAVYGISGAYTAYLYAWNGTTYLFDEYRMGANRCDVRATVACSPQRPGWVAEVLDNKGTAYATVRTTKLTPSPRESVLDFPIAGAASVTRWMRVREPDQPPTAYAITTSVVGSGLPDYQFAGTC